MIFRRFFAQHRWSSWTKEILECPNGEPVVIELWQRHCLLDCGAVDEKEVKLSCVSS